MKKKWILLIFLIIIIIIAGIAVGFLILPLLNIAYTYSVENAFPNLSFNNPVGIYDANDGTDRLFVVEQGGIIWTFNNNRNEIDKYKFLDISDQIVTGGERGLLGLAFHPNYEVNGYLYVYYTKLGTGESVISRFKVNVSDQNMVNKSSEFEIIPPINQPFSNHNGGQISFGPDGYLYIALGDGGGTGDPFGNAQNRANLLGNILRIDVDSGSPFSIPLDNPFYNNMDGFREEIYAFGFRNPWRFSFDNNTGNLWVADVGQESWEEINIVESGKNYGWNAKEGYADFNPGVNVTSTEPPIYVYANAGPDISITGGYIYRGLELTGLSGKYIYADFGSGKIWALSYNSGNVIENELLIDTNFNIPSFGIDNDKNLYICSFDGNIYILNELAN
ncbi:MAG: glucose sorbosone dehydrogenase [Promethearchaeota archaeon]|nr:MAG: glucose sorbosone dehydrogenase [Candidatus Lokiarchaeota archaeon]